MGPSLNDSLGQPSDLNDSPIEEILSDTTIETETQEDNQDNPQSVRRSLRFFNRDH